MVPKYHQTLTLIQYFLVPFGLVHVVQCYDGYTTCSKPFRTSKMRAELPCDFRTQNWCIIPGSAYPWHAVRRFVFENHGLMRRMYGEQRHISVLRAEIDSNDVEYNDGWHGFHEATFKRYERPNSTPLRQTSPTTIDPTPITTGFSSSTTTTSTSTTSATPTTNTLNTNTVVTQVPINVSSDFPSPIRYGFSTGATAENNSTTSDVKAKGDQYFNATLVNHTVATTEDEGSITVSTETGPDTTTVPEDTSSSATVTATLTETPKTSPQMFQETSSELPMYKHKGINACPVKEEVVAPFWANNTRGEILALLNLYPFEQYVHWERCTYEHKQMYCRQGCRCEQQYRLHRLLAYDPTNDCRGIFSDWFKFPSCCVCKCYDLPADLKITSRSPRGKEPKFAVPAGWNSVP